MGNAEPVGIWGNGLLLLHQAQLDQESTHLECICLVPIKYFPCLHRSHMLKNTSLKKLVATTNNRMPRRFTPTKTHTQCVSFALNRQCLLRAVDQWWSIGWESADSYVIWLRGHEIEFPQSVRRSWLGKRLRLGSKGSASQSRTLGSSVITTNPFIFCY